MAEQNDSEKTEEPTGRKLEEAQKKGDIFKSQEINAWFVMLGGALAVGMMGNSFAGTIMETLKVFLAAPQDIPMDRDHLRQIMLHIGTVMFGAMAAPLGILVVSAVAGNVVQHMPVFTTENMKPSWSKLSPMKGIERLFGAKSLVNLAKSIIKFFIVGSVIFMLIWPERDRLALMMTWDISLLLPLVKALALKMFGGVVAVMTIVAALDYLFERFQWMKKQRMSVQEIKDEHKQMEGDPTVKAKLRQIRIERGRKRMMQKVPKATVVIMNPTHYAVALQYEKGMTAPVCVAKGRDAIALKIREIAEAAGVPVIENPPLARALHASVELDQEIRPEHYKAVAEVIGYVMRLRAKIGRRAGSR
ncbi:MAG: flagellar biosynthesis protein FlhB [Parvibaculum sp.]|jgi:flagellar biosynthetic protein FlhB|uniref:flagellar biosynthesis protein FlhB n=1 Tax=Parvibaculum sp. TaxID=2024848 RepID=UPI002844BB64|nr:flagellar biosynthesis protein FlhB [Parvibaculum sp.]MDR3500586.1 flagellar biosynthesis protein FlhB [Parvibaculum sp.]